MNTAFNLKTIGLAALLGTALVTACGDDDDQSTVPTGPSGPATTTTSTSNGGSGGTSTTTTSSGGNGGMGGQGGGVTQDCATYCGLMTANCTGANKQYDGADPTQNCMDTCALFAPGTAADMSGDTLGCRIYHAGVAGMMDAGLHCPHAGPLGAATCGADQCTVFCGLMAAACTGTTDEVYTSGNMAACKTDCDAYADATTPYVADAADMTNSLQCRGYHLTAATTGSVPHCAHVGGPNADGGTNGNSTVCTQ